MNGRCLIVWYSQLPEDHLLIGSIGTRHRSVLVVALPKFSLTFCSLGTQNCNNTSACYVLCFEILGLITAHLRISFVPYQYRSGKTPNPATIGRGMNLDKQVDSITGLLVSETALGCRRCPQDPRDHCILALCTTSYSSCLAVLRAGVGG